MLQWLPEITKYFSSVNANSFEQWLTWKPQPELVRSSSDRFTEGIKLFIMNEGAGYKKRMSTFNCGKSLFLHGICPLHEL